MVGLDRPTTGQVSLDGQPFVGTDGSVERSLRHRVQLVFQDPHASFDPRRTVGRSVGLPLRAGGMGGRATRARVAELLEGVGLDPRLAERLPHTLSGGQLQRAAIARALAPEPDILVCDEPVASMDVSVRAQILNLLLDLRRERGIGVLFVSHDLGVVRRIADRVAVMYLGRIVESGGSEPVWQLPRHPYTRSLAASIPTGSTTWRGGMGVPRLEGEPPSPVDVPPGCRFHPRCPIAIDRCRTDDPVLRPFPPDVRVACHLAELAEPAPV
jgi:oligopeptide/dipeptide ABC transporter ATP-binding protein